MATYRYFQRAALMGRKVWTPICIMMQMKKIVVKDDLSFRNERNGKVSSYGELYEGTLLYKQQKHTAELDILTFRNIDMSGGKVEIVRPPSRGIALLRRGEVRAHISVREAPGG